MKVVVGLGNPGKRYRQTPHNVGFNVVDRIACDLNCVLRKSFRFKARIGNTVIGEESVLLVKPETFMNLSGRAVGQILNYRKSLPADMIVVLDDADLGIGTIRIKAQGSSGGHKGLASIIECVGNDEFARVRIGIGRNRLGKDLVEHVLTAFSAEEKNLIDKVITRAEQAVLCILNEGIEEAMNKFNGSLRDV